MTITPPRVGRLLRKLMQWNATGQPPPGASAEPTSQHQHYVPKAYLRQFYRPKGENRTAHTLPKKGHLRVIDLSRQSPPTVMEISNVAAIQDFYRLDTPDPRWANTLEWVWGQIEGEAAYVFRRIRDGHFPDDDDRESLSAFLALQHTRGPDLVARMAAAGPEAVIDELKAWSPELVEKVLRVVPDKPGGTERALVMLTMMRRAGEGVGQLYPRRWSILRSPIPLATSDSPLMLLPEPGAGLRSADLVLVPLSRFAVLQMSTDARAPHCVFGQLSEEQAFVTNMGVAVEAHRYVIHHPDDEPYRGVDLPLRHLIRTPFGP